MELILLLTALAVAGVLATLRLALAGRREEERRRRERQAFEVRLAERVRLLNDRLVRLEDDRRRLAEADDRKGRLLIALEERLRGPLNVIQGFADLTRARAVAAPADEGLSHRQAQALDHIAEAVGRLTRVTDELSDLGRIETGRLDLRIERLDAVLMLRLALEGRQAGARDAGVTFHGPEPVAGVGVMADRFRLEQILGALAAQAAARTPVGGVVVAEARPEADRVRFVVRDGGARRSPEEMARALRPFAAGSGAEGGLAAARRLAEAMGGRLEPSGPEDPVSALVLTLPAAQAAAPDFGGATLPSATLLYVDDDPAAVTVMRRILAALGPVGLHAATTGAEAMDLARALKPDLVLTELALPDMEGYDLCLRLSADPLTRDTPVLALTARTGPAAWRRAREAGMVACLAKPMEITALARALAAILGARPASPRPLSPGLAATAA